MLLHTPVHDTTFTAPSFSLVDVVTGNEVSLDEANIANGFVVAFICNHCPYVQAAIDDFVAVSKKFQAEDIPVFAIMSNNYAFVEADSPENMKLFVKERGVAFPYLVDEDQSVAHAYGAVCTPDFFGFNAERSMQYRGNIEGLEAAMLQIKETGIGPEKQSPSSGCSIKWKE